MREEDVDAAMAELDAVRDDLMARPGVVAVEVGLLRRPDGSLGDEVGIVVTTLPEPAPEPGAEGEAGGEPGPGAAPPAAALPSHLGRFPVQVVHGRPGLERGPA